jgi:hypothetical protein
VGRDPNVELLKASLQDLLETTHSMPVVLCVLDVKTHAQKLIVIDGPLIQPSSSYYDRIRAGSAELLDKFVVRLHELFRFDQSPIVIVQRE